MNQWPSGRQIIAKVLAGALPAFEHFQMWFTVPYEDDSVEFKNDDNDGGIFGGNDSEDEDTGSTLTTPKADFEKTLWIWKGCSLFCKRTLW